MFAGIIKDKRILIVYQAFPTAQTRESGLWAATFRITKKYPRVIPEGR